MKASFVYPIVAISVSALIQFAVFSLQGANGDKVSCGTFLVFQSVLLIGLTLVLRHASVSFGVPGPLGAFLVGLALIVPQRTLADNAYCLKAA